MIDNIKSALNSIWSNKVRSLLTVLGIVIGVSSVTILVSLGQGLKKEVSTLIQGFGTNVIVIIGGKIDTTSAGSGGFGGGSVNPADFVAGDILTRADIIAIRATNQIEAVAPMSLVPGNIKFEDKTSTPTIFGTSPDILEAFGILELEEGRMFAKETDAGVIVIGNATATDLFGEGMNAIGKIVQINKQDFEVIGQLAKGKSTSLFGSEYDNLAIVPTAVATKFNKDQEKIMRIVAKASDSADVKAVKADLKTAILATHEGEDNFTVFTQDDLLGLMDEFLNLSTALVSAIAAISLIVGGIGIMNIMLVTVTERTAEIGLRKALGATKFAIATQFLTEAVVVTMLGGMIGLSIAIGVSFIVASQTPLTPEVTPQVILLATGISTIVGIIFGLWPAMRAAQKDPIEALRHE